MMKRLSILFFVALLVLLPAVSGLADDADILRHDNPLVMSNGLYEQINNTPIFQTTPLDLKLIDVGTVADIPREDTVKLDNGAIYKIENIRVPVNFFPAVTAYLKKTLIGKKVGIYINPSQYTAKYDDSGSKLGQIVTADGTWVQADIVRQGMAWVTSKLFQRDLVFPLYKIEDEARKNRLGLWVDPQYMLKNDATIQNTYGSFQVFQGTVKSVNTRQNYIFVNFGDDVSKDFTIVILDVIENFSSQTHRLNLNPKYWVGHQIRVRGWVQKNNGPMIQITHPEQIEYPNPIPHTYDNEKK